VHKRIRSAVKTVMFVSDKILCIVLTGHCYDTVVPNLHVPTEDESNNTKDRFYEELDCVFNPYALIFDTFLLVCIVLPSSVKSLKLYLNVTCCLKFSVVSMILTLVTFFIFKQL
jgi:hypothetical protein